MLSSFGTEKRRERCWDEKKLHQTRKATKSGVRMFETTRNRNIQLFCKRVLKMQSLLM